MSLTIRPVRPTEYDAVARLTLEAYDADGQIESTGYEKTLADVGTRAREGTVLVALDETTGAVLGAVTVVLPGSRYAELSAEGEAEFRMLAVDPTAQRRGVGRALVQACLDRAVELGCRAVVISVRDFAERAQHLYAAMGFTRTPELDWSPLPGVQLLAMRVLLPAGVRSGTA